MTNKAEAWRNWWKEKHGNNMPMGGYHPMEGHIHDAFTAGWEAHAAQWVGLTKEEAKEISLANRPYVIDMIAALEARLKEKNT
jgi:hypothetical protein